MFVKVKFVKISTNGKNVIWSLYIRRVHRKEKIDETLSDKICVFWLCISRNWFGYSRKIKYNELGQINIYQIRKKLCPLRVIVKNVNCSTDNLIALIDEKSVTFRANISLRASNISRTDNSWLALSVYRRLICGVFAHLFRTKHHDCANKKKLSIRLARRMIYRWIIRRVSNCYHSARQPAHFRKQRCDTLTCAYAEIFARVISAIY